jgi:hypothetical protein
LRAQETHHERDRADQPFDQLEISARDVRFDPRKGCLDIRNVDVSNVRPWPLALALG